ncbi:MAG: hypothetical protein HRU29_03630 [Rhizobiales bacterium]|nr:hypothetical protein [Hyphomicrobiales bacterium]NRB13470.1 hypothetical protein [Hyphomicrobiales bacterium]
MQTSRVWAGALSGFVFTASNAGSASETPAQNFNITAFRRARMPPFEATADHLHTPTHSEVPSARKNPSDSTSAPRSRKANSAGNARRLADTCKASGCARKC